MTDSAGGLTPKGTSEFYERLNTFLRQAAQQAL
jgi:hypothetical protein